MIRSQASADIFPWASDLFEGDATTIPRKTAIQDCFFLIFMVLLSGLPYVGKLGFYADDWAFLGARHSVRQHSLIALFHSLGPFSVCDPRKRYIK